MIHVKMQSLVSQYICESGLSPNSDGKGGRPHDIARELLTCEKKAREAFDGIKLPRYTVLYKLDDTRTAGGFAFQYTEGHHSKRVGGVTNRRLLFNLDMLRLNTWHETIMTVRHEYAHYLAVTLRGDAQHSKYWKRLCVDVLHGDGLTSHEFTTVNCLDESELENFFEWLRVQ